MPDENLEALLPKVKAISDEVAADRALLLSHYDAWVQEWADAHPLAKNEILARAPKLAYVSSQVGFSLRVFKINPQVEAVAAVGCQDGIADEIGGLTGQITHEIAQDVRDSWKPGAEGASQKIRGLLKRVAQKAKSLAFIDGRLAQIAKFVEDTASTLPSSGRIEGRDFLVLSGLMGVLSSPDKLLAGRLGFDMPAEVEEVEVEAKEVAVIEGLPDLSQVVIPPAKNAGIGKAAYAW